MAVDLYSGSVRTKRQRLELMRSSMWSVRSSFDAHWRDLADYIAPRRVRFTGSDRNRGDKRNQYIIDSTARFALRTLQSGLHAGLTSPARPWFKLTTPDPDLAEYEPVKEWLHLTTQRMLTVFLQSNLYNTLPVVYGDMGCFGTAAMSVLEDRHGLFRTYPYPVGSYALGMSDRGIVSTFVREYELSVRQVVEQFGVVPGRTEIDWSTISSVVHQLWDQGNYEAPVPIVWVVMPNEGANPNRLESKYLPFTSCHFEAGNSAGQAGEAGGTGTFLRESGFRTFPIMAPRWDITGEDSYGTDCPGMLALGDVKQLQEMQREKGKAIKKQVTPAVVGPTSLMTQKTSLLPGDITYVDVREGMGGLRAIHDVNINLADLTADMRECQYRIQRGFYEDLFLMIAQSDRLNGAQPPTAREIEERHEEKLLALGPVLERTNDELLDPLIDRVYLMMEAAGLVPEAPDELHGITLRVEYISIMAQAQKLVGVVGADRFLQSIVPLVETGLVNRHKINGNQVIDNYGEMLGVDPRVIRPNEEADAMAAEEAKAAAAQANAEQAKNLAQAAATAGAAPIAPSSPLDRVLTGMGGGVAPSA